MNPLLLAFVMILIPSVFGTQNCVEPSPGEGLLNGQKTDCVEFFSNVPGYLVYSENGLASNSSPIAVAFVSSQLNGFRLIRDRDVEEDCPSFFALSASQIDSWVTSLNPEDVVNSLNDICFTKYDFAEKTNNLLSFKIIYKVSAESQSDGSTIYKPRKVAVSTPGGSEFIFLDQTEDLAQICTTCKKSETALPATYDSELPQSSTLAEVLNGLI